MNIVRVPPPFGTKMQSQNEFFARNFSDLFEHSTLALCEVWKLVGLEPLCTQSSNRA